MTIVRSNSGTANANNFTVSLGQASTVGNRIVVCVVGNNVIPTPSGWTSRQPQVVTMGHYIFDRAADGASSWPFVVGSPQTVGLETWVAFEIAGGAYDIAAGSNSGGGSGITTPTITPTAGNRHIIASVGVVDSSSAKTFSGWSGGFVEQFDLSVAGGDNPSQGVALLSTTANGATGYATTVAESPAGTFARSGIIAAYSWSAAADTTPPTVPANLRTTAVGATTADLAWDAATDDVGVTGYEVVVTGPL